jgi:hypothetical protein
VYSDIKRPGQALNKHPQPTDHRGGNSSEIEEFEDAGIHSLTMKRDDQLDAALLAIQPAEQPGVTSAVLHSER